MRADRWDYGLDKALTYLQQNRGKPARQVLEEMVERGVIRGYKVTPLGYIYLQTGSGWHGTMFRTSDFGYRLDYIQKE